MVLVAGPPLCSSPFSAQSPPPTACQAPRPVVLRPESRLPQGLALEPPGSPPPESPFPGKSAQGRAGSPGCGIRRAVGLGAPPP